jgi:hypothetical protein
MNKTTVLAIVISIVIGGLAGYWWRGQRLLTQEQMTATAIMGAPPQVVKLAPGPGPRLPLVDGNVPPAKR